MSESVDVFMSSYLNKINDKISVSSPSRASHIKPGSDPESDSECLDVIIVGAGLSGLSAAYQLHQTVMTQPGVGEKLKVAILEARSRVGGKVFSTALDEHWLEQGALFIDDGYHQLLSIAKNLDIPLENRYTRSHSMTVLPRVYVLHDREWTLDELEAYFTPLFKALLSLSQQSGLVYDQALNLLSVQQCVQQLKGVSQPLKDDYLALIDCIFAAEYGFHVDELNAHHLFEVDHCEQYPIRWLTRHFGLQPYRIKGGNQRLAKALAAAIPEHWLRLEHKVNRIDQIASDAFQLSITTTNEDQQLVTKKLVSKQLILAVPINLYRHHTDGVHSDSGQSSSGQFCHIDLLLAKPLPTGLASAFCDLKTGRNKKVFLHFDRPVWVDVKQNREIMSLIHPEFRAWNGGDLESASGSSIVTLFLSGRAAESSYDQVELEALAQRFIKAVASVMPVITSAKLLDIIDGTTWSQEPESKGSYGGAMLPGQWLSDAGTNGYDQWIAKSSVGALHWVGSEWDTKWAGFMEGAIASGLTKGQEVARRFLATPTV